MEKETQDEMVKMKVRNFVGMIIAIITITNSFSLGWQKILRNEETAAYNKERSDRIAKRTLDEAKEYHKRKELEAKLEKCMNK